MIDRQVAAGWEAQRFITAWHRRHRISTNEGWLAVVIQSMWLAGDPPDTTLTAEWSAGPDHDPRRSTVALWNPDESPASTHLSTQLRDDARRLAIPTSTRPATELIAMHDLFEAMSSAWLWGSVHMPRSHRTHRVGLIGTHPETLLAIDFPTPDGLYEFRSEIWQSPGQPKDDANNLAADLHVRFMEGS